LGDAIQSHFEGAQNAHLAYVPKIASAMVEGSLKESEKKIVLQMSGQRAVLVAKMITILLLKSGAQLIFQMSQASQ